MIERTCDIVEIPGGGLAALMPLSEVAEKHWVAVQETGDEVLRASGHIHRQNMARRIATQPWDEGWNAIGRREVVVVEPDVDFDIGGGD